MTWFPKFKLVGERLTSGTASKIAKGESEETLPQMTIVVVLFDVVTFIGVPFSM